MRLGLPSKVKLLLLGFILGLILLELMLRSGGFLLSYEKEKSNLVSLRKRADHVILALGESTTEIGDEYSWPSQLEKILNENSLGKTFAVINKGESGTNSTRILKQLEENLEKYKPNIVVAMMGINDTEPFTNLGGGFVPTDEKPSDSRLTSLVKELRIYRLMRFLAVNAINTISSKLTPEYDQQRVLEQAVKENPNDYNARIELGRFYRLFGKDDKVEEQFRAAMQINPDNERAYIELGSHWADRKRYEQAEELFKKALELNPENEWAYLELGLLYRMQSQIPSGTWQASRAPSGARGGKETEAENMLLKAKSINPVNEWVISSLANLYASQKRFGEAKTLLEKALSINPSNEYSHMALGSLHQLQGNTEEAQKAYEESIRIFPKNDWAMIRLGLLYAETQKFEEAKKALEKASKTRPENEWSLVELARLYESQGKVEDAEETYKKAVEVDPKNDWAYTELANFYQSLGRYEEARAEFEKAQEIYPLRNTKTYLHRKEYEEAKEFLKVIAYTLPPHPQLSVDVSNPDAVNFDEKRLLSRIKETPDNDRFYLELGQLYRKIKRDEDAEGMFKKGMETNVSAEWPYIELGTLYRDQGKDEELKKIFEIALQKFPNQEWPYIELGKIYQQAGRYQEAEEIFKKALSVNPPRKERIYLALEDLYREIGLSQKALGMQTQAFELNPFPKQNYITLKDALKTRGIRLVAVQYPLRSIESLKRLLDYDSDVIYVDNESSFREAIRESSYDDYFLDRFAGDFGHATAKGNYLIAKNVANAILGNLFYK